MTSRGLGNRVSLRFRVFSIDLGCVHTFREPDIEILKLDSIVLVISMSGNRVQNLTFDCWYRKSAVSPPSRGVSKLGVYSV